MSLQSAVLILAATALCTSCTSLNITPENAVWHRVELTGTSLSVELPESPIHLAPPFTGDTYYVAALAAKYYGPGVDYIPSSHLRIEFEPSGKDSYLEATYPEPVTFRGNEIVASTYFYDGGPEIWRCATIQCNGKRVSIMLRSHRLSGETELFVERNPIDEKLFLHVLESIRFGDEPLPIRWLPDYGRK